MVVPREEWKQNLINGQPVAGEGFDYGFKTKAKASEEERGDADAGEEEEEESASLRFPDEAFHMVTQLNWEDDVVWNGDDIKNKVLQKLSAKGGLASGWLPTSTNRMALAAQKAAPASKEAAPAVSAKAAALAAAAAHKAGTKLKVPVEEAPVEDVWSVFSEFYWVLPGFTGFQSCCKERLLQALFFYRVSEVF